MSGQAGAGAGGVCVCRSSKADSSPPSGSFALGESESDGGGRLRGEEREDRQTDRMKQQTGLEPSPHAHLACPLGVDYTVGTAFSYILLPSRFFRERKSLPPNETDNVGFFE